jgi:hypothetical protein
MTGTPRLMTETPDGGALISRAFKRGLGFPPASWRMKSRETAARRTA